MKTFSSEVKSGIIERRFNNNQLRFLCLYGILRTLKKCSSDEIVLKTSHSGTAGLFSELVGLVTAMPEAADTAVTEKKDGGKLYRISVNSRSAREKLLNEFHIKTQNTDGGGIDRDLVDSVSTAGFFAGVFLSVGSVADPSKGYHMEFSFANEKTADDFAAFADLLPDSFTLKKITRKGRTILYTKSADSISDFLTFIGAPEAAIKLMNTEILKNVRNKANRIANCDSANIERAVSAGSRQAEEIEFLYKRLGRDNLKPSLRIAADLRLENPELTLAELGEMFDPPLSRSGVNRRLAKLSEMAGELKG
ncbi:MAG: DNA-binding protein WhiA [Ruminococcus sp.]|jgi:DNA-binding protein WhiA|nr:DNA-binding protein WhiA [Ruminococcus sp.]